MKKRMNPRHIVFGIICISVAVAAVVSCGRDDARSVYKAEKELFKARSLRDKIAGATNKSEFLDRTVQAYRDIVKQFSPSTEDVDGLEEIVLFAQMELAQLEYQFFRYENAKKDFTTAYNIAKNTPEARANARYSIAIISSEMGDHEDAIVNFEKFHEEFLGRNAILQTVEMNTAYLLTPLKLYELNMSIGNEDKAREWLLKAEEDYLHAIKNGRDPASIKEIRFNLLTAYLQGREWKKSRDTVQELKKLYKEEVDAPVLLYLEANIYRGGFADSRKALSLYEEIYTKYPRSMEAPIALLASGSIMMDAMNIENAKSLYKRVLDEYPDARSEGAEATWHLAIISETQGDWLNAVLLYESISINYPGTLQGLEAPLQIANHYKKNGEAAAAKAAYGKAINHYNELISKYVDTSIKVTAENYIIRAFSEQEQWREAAERLLMLPDRYPAYSRLRGNYLLAASIYEKELGEGARAVGVLKRCLDKYPETALAEEAERQLKRLEDRK